MGSRAPDTQDELHGEDPVETDVYMINGAILPQEWERIRMHAEFVQNLGHSPLRDSSSEKHRYIASSTVSFLGRLAGGTSFLPNLRTLRWTLETTQSTALFPLISPSIDVLNMTVFHESTLTNNQRRQWHAFIRSTLFLVTSVSMHITDLDFACYEDLPIAEPMSRLQSLRRFITAKADGDLLRVLAALPNLQEMRLGSIAESAHDLSAQASTGFPRVQRFSVEQHPKTTGFYRLFGVPGLRRLSASFRDVDDHLDILACCSAWARHFPSLEELTLSVYLSQDTLYLSRVYSNDCALVALLIDQLFPHLHCPLDILGTAMDPENPWEKVQRHIRIYQLVRQQQTKRTASSAPAATTA